MQNSQALESLYSAQDYFHFLVSKYQDGKSAPTTPCLSDRADLGVGWK